MARFRDISIRNKLILMLVGTSVLVLSIFSIAFIITDAKAFKQRKVNSMISLAQVIGTNAIPMLQFEDQEAAKEILSGLHNGAPEIIHAALIDEKGSLFASYSKPGADSVPLSRVSQQQDAQFNKEQLYVTHNIIDNNHVLGKVFLDVDLAELSALNKSKFEIAGILLLIAAGFTFFVAMGIQTYISKRLLYLVNKMRDVSISGKYDQAMRDEGKDEIGQLVRGFDELMQKIKENEQKKDEFIGVASHELKTPLTSIKGYVELLTMIEDKEAAQHCVQKVLDNVNKLERLIKDLLDVSKIQSGQLELSLREFSIDSLVDETISTFQMISTTHEIRRENGPVKEMVLADRQRIEQVLINLLSNAIKYSPGEKMVVVETSKANDEMVIKVRDFGIGISPEEKENVFERFYRTRNSSMHISGFGLGLYISRDIVKRHQGRIWVEPEEKGCAFYFSLPLKGREKQPTQPGKIESLTN